MLTDDTLVWYEKHLLLVHKHRVLTANISLATVIKLATEFKKRSLR